MKQLASLIFLLLIPLVVMAQTGPNLVTNGGFEDGDLTGYTLVTDGQTVVAATGGNYYGPSHSGNYFLAGGDIGSQAFLSQTVPTAAYSRYTLTYYVLSYPAGGFTGNPQTPNEFSTKIGATTVFDQMNLTNTTYQQFTFNFVATGPTTLTFGLRDDPAFLNLDDISVYLISTVFASVPGLTPNQSAVANYIDLHSPAPSSNLAAVIAALQGLTPEAIPGALNELTPQAFGQFTSMTAFNNASFETEAMDNYLAGLRAGPGGTFTGGNGRIDASGLTLDDPSYDPGLAVVHSRLLAWNPGPVDGAISDVVQPVLGGVDAKDMKSMSQPPAYTDPWNFFVRGNVILAQGFSSADVAHFDDNTESVVLGTDYRINPNLLVGLTAGYGHTDVTLDENGSSATVDSYSPGLYASYADKGWYADLTGDYVHNAYTQSRVIGFLGQTANSAPEGNEGLANIDGGYDFHRGALTFGPLAGLQYTHLTVDGYRETGSVADLDVNHQEDDSLRSRVGGRVSFSYAHYGMVFTPHLDASWQHEFMDPSRGITSQFDGAGLGSFTVRTDRSGRDSALTEVGLDLEINRSVTAFADYQVQAGQENYFGQAVQGGVKIGF
jgi:uncharacterized protein YhjY with autotransporter beta-barrel domain